MVHRRKENTGGCDDFTHPFKDLCGFYLIFFGFPTTYPFLKKVIFSFLQDMLPLNNFRPEVGRKM